MTEYLPRAAWTSHPKPSALASMPIPVGFSVHWPGTTKPIGDPGRAAIAARLEGYRKYHTDPVPAGRGWTDIAYQVAVDQAGRVWDLRGIEHQSAANGGTAQNRSHGAVLLLLGPDEAPSTAMVEAVQQWRQERWLARYPHATAVVGHQDIRPDGTDCPGSAAQRLVRAGTFKEGPDMGLSAEDRAWILDQLEKVPGANLAALRGAGYPNNPGDTGGYLKAQYDDVRAARAAAETVLTRVTALATAHGQSAATLGAAVASTLTQINAVLEATKALEQRVSTIQAGGIDEKTLEALANKVIDRHAARLAD